MNNYVKSSMYLDESNFEFLSGLVIMLFLSSLPFLSRTALAFFLILTLLLFCLWSSFYYTFELGNTSKWLLIALISSIFSSVFSPFPLPAFKGLFEFISYIAMYGLIRKILSRNKRWWGKFLASIIVSQLLVSVIAIRQLYSPFYQVNGWLDTSFFPEGVVRVYGTFGNPNLLAGYLVALLPLSFYAVIRWRKSLLIYPAFLSSSLGFFAIMFTYSRGAWLGSIAGIGCLICIAFNYSEKSISIRKSYLLPTFAILTIICTFIIPYIDLNSIFVRFSSIFSGEIDSSISFRINVWIAALDMIRERPFIGFGTGDNVFFLAYPLYQKSGFDALSPYSVPLQILISHGVIGLFVSLSLLFNAIKDALLKVKNISFWKGPSFSALAALTATLAMGMTDTIFFRPEVQIITFFCLATMAHSKKIE